MIERVVWVLWAVCFVVWIAVELSPPSRDEEALHHLKDTHGATAECLERLLRREQEMRTPLPYR